MDLRPTLGAIYTRVFAENRIVALVFPSVTAVAPRIGQDAIEIGGSKVTVFDAMTRNCWPASVADLPGLCLPAPASGLPVGLEIDGAEGDDDRVIALGLALETLFATAPKG